MAEHGDAIRALAGGRLLDPVDTPSVADVIAERLVRAISDGVLRPGDRLPTEAELAREFRVGRTSVREGLQKLRAYRLIESRKGLGAFVREPNSEDPLAAFARWTARDPAGIEKLLEARIALETTAAGLAAARASEQQLALLEEHQRAHAAADERQDVDGLVSSDDAFHKVVFAAADNDTLSRLYQLLIPELTDFRRKTLALPWAASRSAHGHAAILLGIQRRDSASARAAMGDHLWVLYTEVHGTATRDGHEAIGLEPAPRSALV